MLRVERVHWLWHDLLSWYDYGFLESSPRSWMLTNSMIFIMQEALYYCVVEKKPCFLVHTKSSDNLWYFKCIFLLKCLHFHLNSSLNSGLVTQLFLDIILRYYFKCFFHHCCEYLLIFYCWIKTRDIQRDVSIALQSCVCLCTSYVQPSCAVVYV